MIPQFCENNNTNDEFDGATVYEKISLTESKLKLDRTSVTLANPFDPTNAIQFVFYIDTGAAMHYLRETGLKSGYCFGEIFWMVNCSNNPPL